MRKNTSTEFEEWQVFYQMKEWEQKSKQDYYLAQIAAEIRLIRNGLAGVKTSLSLEEFILTSKTGTPPSPNAGRPEIECSPEAMADPRWAAVNAQAKAEWALRFGLSSPDALETLPGG